MSFQKKQRTYHDESRPQASKLAQREHKVQVLKGANNPDARRALKKMNDKVYRGSRSNLTEWFKPNGKGLTCKP